MNDAMIGFDDLKDLTVLDYSTVMEHLKKIAKQEKLDTDSTIDMSNTLTSYFIQSNFSGVSAQEANECITDGPNDQGIDAIFIDEETDGTKVVNIIQTKLSLNKSKFNDTRFSANEVGKLLATFNDLVLNDQHRDHANARLKSRLDDLSELEGLKYKIILLTTAALPPAIDAQDKLSSKLDHYNDTSEYVTAEFVGLSQLLNLLPELKEVKINFELTLDGVPVDANVGSARVVIGQIQARKIAELVDKKKQKLFDRNVRIYLKKRNQVNSQIFETASDEERSSYFFILNNGITIICDKLKYFKGRSSPTIEITAGQIVNGGQTSNSIYEAYRSKVLDDKASVLIRIIETDDKDLVHEITKATNTQTAVRNPDLYSNDPIQKKIRSHILDKFGHYYEAKKNEAQTKTVSKFRIDKEAAAQAYYSYALQKPGEAKTNKSKLFGEYYKLIFDDMLADDSKVDMLFFSYQLLSDLKTVSNNEEFKKYRWIKDAMLTSLAILKNASNITNYEELNKDRVNNHVALAEDYQKLLNATDKVIKEELLLVGEGNFEKRRFFIAPNTLNRIEKALYQK